MSLFRSESSLTLAEVGNKTSTLIEACQQSCAWLLGEWVGYRRCSYDLMERCMT